MERKLREIHGSLVVAIPKQIADLYGFKKGDTMEFSPLDFGELKICKSSQ